MDFNNNDGALLGLYHNEECLKYTQETLKDDREFIIKALKEYGCSLQYASKRL